MNKKTNQTLSRNHNWKGGRVIASNGYVLIRKPGHPLADIRGYVYEHRLVAEENLGRSLRPGELIHHKDGNKQNNSPDNLLVTNGNGEHFFMHRNVDSNRQIPGEINSIVSCSCGCGETFPKYDSDGRPRKYINGHNSHASPVSDIIFEILANGPTKTTQLISMMQGRKAVMTVLSRLKKKGLIENIEHGLWDIKRQREA